jgi:hypothetical protein
MGQGSSRPAYHSAASNEVSERKIARRLNVDGWRRIGYMVAGLKGITR